MKYKVGDKVRIIKNYSDHDYEIGQIVTIKQVGGWDYLGEEKTNDINWHFIDNECELYAPNQSIHITTDGTKTYGVMKHGNEIVKRVEAKCHEDDEFNFETGAKIVMDRLFEEDKKTFAPYLDGGNGRNYGAIGQETNLTALFGEKLYVGDIIQCYNIEANCSFVDFIINDGSYFGVMGICRDSRNMKNGIAGCWQIRKMKSYKDLNGTEITDSPIKVIYKEK